MVERNGDLNEPLDKNPVWKIKLGPHLLPLFMGIEIFSLIKKLQTSKKQFVNFLSIRQE